MKTISCIIPAYNEEKGIGHTLSVVAPLIGRELSEVIVIDDSSNDGTKEIVKNFPSVLLIEHAVNGGKSKSVFDGIRASKGDYIFLLDADLIFLNEKNVIDLIDPIESGRTDVSLSYRKNAWPLFPFKEIDYLTGERILPKAPVLDSLPAMSVLPSYGLEVFLNRIILRDHLRIAVVQWPNVENDFNQYKYGWLKGIKIVIKIWLNVLSTVSIAEMYSQNIRMRKLLVR